MQSSDIDREQLPPAMLQARRWLLYKLIQRPGKVKPDKVPFYASGKPRNGKLDSKEDLSSLVSFNEALAVAANYSGMGFALGDDGGGGVWQGIDFDDCEKFDAVSVLVKSGLPGYVERSLSGNGWHCIGYGKPFNTLGSRGVGIEAYCKARFFVVTCDCAGGDIEDLSDYVANELVPIYGRHSDDNASEAAQCDTQVIKDLRNALNYLVLDSDNYESWTNIGMMLKTVNPEASGLGLWLDWSKLSDKFSREICLEKWKTFKPTSVNYRSIFYLASRNGWANPGYSVNDSEIDQSDNSWEDGLICSTTKSGRRILSRLHNIVLFLTYLDEYKGRFKFNSFSGLPEIDRKPISDTEDAEITRQLESHIDEKVTTQFVSKGIDLVARKSPYNPLTDYLSSLQWDGLRRVETLFSTYFGSEDNDYCRDVARSFMVSAVARAFVPGEKVDTMVILEGSQGLKKSTFIRRLAGDEWYAPMGHDIGSKDSYLTLSGKWIVDFGDLAGLNKKDARVVKDFLDHEIDSYRKPYDKRNTTVKRSCIFFGSTNEDRYLTDTTGNRRFLPIKCPQVGDISKLINERDQLWAEAVHLYRTGWKWWEVRGAEIEQADRLEYDDWEEDVLRFADSCLHPETITTRNIAVNALGFDIDKVNSAVSRRVGAILRANGYKHKKYRVKNGKPTWIFEKS